MEHYMYVQSDESNVFFEDNTTTKFKIQLKFPLFLPGLWKVALVEFHATENTRVSKITADEGLYLYSDIGKGSIVYGEKRTLLRRLEKNARNKWD